MPHQRRAARILRLQVRHQRPHALAPPPACACLLTRSLTRGSPCQLYSPEIFEDGVSPALSSDVNVIHMLPGVRPRPAEHPPCALALHRWDIAGTSTLPPWHRQCDPLLFVHPAVERHGHMDIVGGMGLG